MDKLKIGDTVQVSTGKDTGKKGKILRVTAGRSRAVVEGINMLKQFRRKTQADQQGGVVAVEAPINISNLMLVCKHCSRPTRVGFMKLGDGKKSRICKSCKEAI
jgi:large subunit ribosomal protein L24